MLDNIVRRIEKTVLSLISGQDIEASAISETLVDAWKLASTTQYLCDHVTKIYAIAEKEECNLTLELLFEIRAAAAVAAGYTYLQDD